MRISRSKYHCDLVKALFKGYFRGLKEGLLSNLEKPTEAAREILKYPDGSVAGLN